MFEQYIAPFMKISDIVVPWGNVYFFFYKIHAYLNAIFCIWAFN